MPNAFAVDWRSTCFTVPGFLVTTPPLAISNPFAGIVDGWFVDWSGYSFASGHTIGATLLYGQLALFIIPMIKNRRGRVLVYSAATFVIVLVGFSRIALGAHYLTDVLGGMFLGTSWLTLCLLVSRPLRRAVVPPVIADVLPDATPALVPVPVPVQAEVAVAPTSELLIYRRL